VKNRAGGVMDMRIGERNPNLTAEDKNMLRWTKEKQVSKSAPFGSALKYITWNIPLHFIILGELFCIF
jgi:hypothetical protein